MTIWEGNMKRAVKVFDDGRDRILSISLAEVGQPFRKIVRRSNAKPTGKYPSWKTGTTHQWESIPERNAFRFLDAWPKARAFSAQSVEIKYVLRGEVHHHYPDILVELYGSSEMWEVKTRKFSMEHSIVERSVFLSMELPKHGYQYKVVVAEDIAQEPRFSTISRLLDLGRQNVPLVERERFRRLIDQGAVMTWGELTNGKFGAKARGYVARLILEGELDIDWESGLRHEARIRQPGSGDVLSRQLPGIPNGTGSQS